MSMGLLLKQDFYSRLFMVLFIILWTVIVIVGIIAKTSQIYNQKIRVVVRTVVCSVIGCGMIYVVCWTFYPVSLAYYEYSNNSVAEAEGMVDTIQYIDKTRTFIIIDNTKYVIIHSSQNPIVGKDKIIDKGKQVHITFGKNSKYVYSISQVAQTRVVNQGTVNQGSQSGDGSMIDEE